MLYCLKLILNKPFLYKNYFLIQFFYAWQHLTISNFSFPISIEEILDQPIILNPQIYHYQKPL